MRIRSSSVEQTFGFNILNFIGRLAAEGRYTLLESYGVRQDQIPKLAAMGFQDQVHLTDSTLLASLVHARIDSIVLDTVFEVVARSQRDKERAQQLIAAGASQKLMQELTGMEGSQYAELRRVLELRGVRASGAAERKDWLRGRPRDLLRDGSKPKDHREAEKIWQVWQELEGTDDIDRWLRTHELTGHSLRTIERVVRSPDGFNKRPTTTPIDEIKK
jgi:hypothetical protein